MKKDIHPSYNTEAKITCACGNVIIVGSTQDAISVDMCSACHPFYTGVQKLVDTAGRVDKFKQKMEKASADTVTKKKAKKVARASKKSEK